MAAHPVLHLPVASLHHESCSPRPRPREDILLKPCTYLEEKFGNGRGSSTVCNAKKHKERRVPFGGEPIITHNEETYGLGLSTGNGDTHMHDDGGLYGCNKGKHRNVTVYYRNRKKSWLDAFNWGDFPEFGSGLEFAEEGLQEAEPLSFPVDPNSEYGFLEFPAKYNVELASLPLLARGDVRKCCCFVTGGVYENLLFFPVIQMLKERYPGVEIDIVASDRGKQTYEINKNVKRAWVHDVNADAGPAGYLEFVGKIKNEDYDLLVSTKLSGAGHAATMWMTSARDKIAYVYPDVNAAGAGTFLTDWAEAPRLNLAEGGYHMYAELIEVLKNPQYNVPEMIVRPLEVGVSKRLRNFLQERYMQEGLSKGEFLVFHGIESPSNASMQSQGDPDSLLPIKQWAEIAEAASMTCVVVVPYPIDKYRVLAHFGKDAKTLFITTPGQLAALINDSVGVVTTNTAAVQLACALKKPSVALFSSAEKASLFVPFAKERRCTVVASETGKLIDVDLKAAIRAMKDVEKRATALVAT